MFIRCNFREPTQKSEPDDWVRHLVLDVFAFDSESDEHLIAKIAADQVLWSDAEDAGEDLFDVFDADSQGLCEVYETLTGEYGKVGEFHPALEIEFPISHIIFIYRAVIHADVRHCQQSIIDTVGNLFGDACVVTMWQDVTDLSDTELSELGFCKIAGSKLHYRRGILKYRYGEKYPRGQGIDVVASPEQERWVREQWGKDWELA